MKYRNTEEETFRQIIIYIITVKANIDTKRSDIDDTDAKMVLRGLTTQNVTGSKVMLMLRLMLGWVGGKKSENATG